MFYTLVENVITIANYGCPTSNAEFVTTLIQGISYQNSIQYNWEYMTILSHVHHVHSYYDLTWFTRSFSAITLYYDLHLRWMSPIRCRWCLFAYTKIHLLFVYVLYMLYTTCKVVRVWVSIPLLSPPPLPYNHRLTLLIKWPLKHVYTHVWHL